MPKVKSRVIALFFARSCFPALLLGPALGLPPGCFPTAAAAPEPEPVPRRWQLRVEPGDLRIAVVDVPGIGPRTYLYMTYKVTNNTGEDRDFAPAFELATDTGQLVRSGREVPEYVTRELLGRIDNPLLKREYDVQGRLLQGEENAEEALVIWRADDLQGGEYSVFMIGFSGETKTVIRPDNGQTHLLRKTLMLRHDGTGILDPQSGRPLTRIQERWVLR